MGIQIRQRFFDRFALATDGQARGKANTGKAEEVAPGDLAHALAHGELIAELGLGFLDESPPFAEALGSILRDKQGIFRPFDLFRVELLRDVGRGSIDLSRLVPLYAALRPALHAGVADSTTVDVGV